MLFRSFQFIEYKYTNQKQYNFIDQIHRKYDKNYFVNEMFDIVKNKMYKLNESYSDLLINSIYPPNQYYKRQKISNDSTNDQQFANEFQINFREGASNV